MSNHFKGPTAGKSGMTITVKNNNIEGAIRQLKKRAQIEGLIKEMKKGDYYETGTMKRKRIKIEAKKRWQKKLRLMNELEISQPVKQR